MSSDRVLRHGTCSCGDPMMYVELVGSFAPRDRSRFVWVHVDRERNLSHQAHP